MGYLGIDEADLIYIGANHTAMEISNQPEVWRKTYKKLVLEEELALGFWERMIKENKKIILTGAGTSAYIGYSLEGSFQRHTGITTISVATTHLVTHPSDYLQKEIPTLMISFARSGNSPESIAAVELADKYCNKCSHLIITCDANGKLANYKSQNEKLCFVLPLETNDKSLAMTSSYTSMLLTGLLFARLKNLAELEKQVNLVSAFGEKIINEYANELREIAKLNFERAVFLGSGPLFGTATESHLKLQELTDGQVICKNDSFLGFRHGPKAVVDEKTLITFIFSNREVVQKYERDLVHSMQNGKTALLTLGISEKKVPYVKLDLEIISSNNGTEIEEEFLSVCSILPAQILGFYKSIELGLKPDNPSISGAISRVVEGVIIYDDLLK